MINKVLELVVLLAILGMLIYVGVKGVPTTGVTNTQPRQEIVKDTQDTVKEIAVCVVDAGPINNPVYYNLPTVATQLVCDGPMGAFVGKRPSTLGRLYADGWSLLLINDPVLEITIEKDKPKRRVYTILYLERTKPRE